MFASEKVMLEYLDQLLSEEETGTVPKKPVADPAVTVKKADINQKTASDSKELVSTSRQMPKIEISDRKTAAERLAASYASKNNTISSRKANYPEEQRTAEIESKPLIQKPSELPKRPFKEPEIAKPEPVSQSIEKLLEQVTEKEEVKIAKERQKTVDLVKSVEQEIAPPKAIVAEEVEVKQQIVVEPKQAKVEQEQFPEEPFQALFFSVAGLSLAVPLYELGGIHKLEEVNSLFGKPAWYKGVMLTRGKNLNVVDSARWVMPEKFNKNMEESLNYQYLIMLGESDWGLAAESLVETETISPDAVKWRKSSNKRPWLMGTIKEKMCALLHVGDLIAMLEQGIDARNE